MATTPIRPSTERQEIDPETERIIKERLATLDEDVKTASSWSEVEARIFQKLKDPKLR
jgi:hypothetical protein